MHAFENRIDAAPEIRLVSHGVIRLPAGRGPRHENVELEFAEKLETLDVSGAIARLEHRGDPLALVEVDGIAGKKKTVGTAPREKWSSHACGPESE